MLDNMPIRGRHSSLWLLCGNEAHLQPLETLWTALETLWTALETLWTALETLWTALETLWTALETLWTTPALATASANAASFDAEH
jgi:hypothetical protein